MKRSLALLAALLCVALICRAQNVTVRAVDEPAAAVFRSIVKQTGKNFVYSSELLESVRVSIDVRDMPLAMALDVIFRDTDVQYNIRGRNIVLRRKPWLKPPLALSSRPDETTHASAPLSWDAPNLLQEVVVVSRLEAPAVETAEIGAKKLTSSEINSTPVLFGESDVLKALQMQPGVSGGTEGMAGMHVHGGNADENLFMLDNVPLYQVNHFAGLFSAFNVDAIRYIDFFKSSVPAKYDGRLSSYLDVRTRDGSPDGHHGSFRLGLTSGALNVSGPIGRRTTYAVALRRSWFDVLTIPFLAINNSSSDEEIRFHYAFMDLNAKLTHRFNSRTRGFMSVYFGDDNLKTGSKDKESAGYSWSEDDKFDLHWGNLVAQTGLNYVLHPSLTAEFTAAYTRYFSAMKHNLYLLDNSDHQPRESRAITNTDNNINDWILRGDFDWQADDANHVRFGAAYTLHRFMPARTSRHYTTGSTTVATRDSTWAYTGGEANIYIEDDWQPTRRLHLNVGFHGSLFSIGCRSRLGASPRLSLSYRPSDGLAVKGAYSRTTQYVHQLCQTYLSLPTDQWVPVTGRFKPQTADKFSLGGYWQAPGGLYEVSLEAYYKTMHHLVDYRDEYYLEPPVEMWNSRLCSGSGTAKGLDLNIEKQTGKLTGHIAYSLAWADRTFADKNGGRTFPARFDHRHTINILLNWHASDRVQINAAWTGHSGNRFTLLTQSWEAPDFDPGTFGDDSPLRASVNNYQLPFYHRLDLSCTVRSRRGFWNFGLYNAYCHLNTVAIRRSYTRNGHPVFQKVRMLPIIPSISYTWQF